MNFPKPYIFTFLFLLSTLYANAQFGQRLKDKLKEAKKGLEKDLDRLGNKADATLAGAYKNKEELDTTIFNHALSQADKSSFFRNRDNKQSFVGIAAKFGEEISEGRTNADKAFDLNRVASTSMYVNKTAATKAFAKIFDNYLFGGGNGIMTNVHPDISEAIALQKYNDLIKRVLKNGNLNRMDHYALATTTLNISLMMHAHGKVRKASKMTEFLKAYVYDKLGEGSLIAAAVHNNLAVILKDQGHYIEAEEYYKKCKKTLIAREQKEKLSYAILTNNIAMLHQATGRYESAVSLLQQCLTLTNTKLRKKGSDFSKFKINLALVYQSQGQYDKAESIYRSLLVQKEKRLGQNHPDYAQTQNSLASLMMLKGNTTEVEKLLLNALDIYENKLGENHPAYAVTLTNLGKYYRHVDRLEDADRIFEKVKGLYESSFNKNHPGYVNIIENIALLNWQKGNIKLASTGYEEAIDMTLAEVDKNFASLSESEKSKYWNTIRPMILRFYNFAIDNADLQPELLSRVYELQMATKGLLLSSTVKMKYKILNSGDESLIDLYQFWSDTKEDLARYYTYSKNELKEESINLDSLEEVANNAEKELSKRSYNVTEDQSNGYISYSSLVDKIGSGEAALEIVRLPKYDKKKFTEETDYIFLIAKASSSFPAIAIIKEGNLVETKYAQAYKNSIQYKVSNKRSYEQFWGAVGDQVSDVSKIYLSADGVYNQVNVATLKNPEDKYLGEKHTFIHVSNTNLLVSDGISQISSISKAALFGNPDYGSHEVSDLPGTAVEVNNIGGMLKSKRVNVETYTAKEANEANFKQINTPSILHVATHGFFLNSTAKDDNQVFGERIEPAEANPMLRSGLVLSGADKRKDLVLDGYADDGIITAYEVLTLDLASTDMVVLSACETGLGEVRAGEGVYGLQRAFKVAGANTLIMSLWKVNDETTQQLMTSFYKNLLSSKDKIEAFELAQAEIRSDHPEPYYWGAFVMMN